jgi:hypothetical protein
MDVQLNPDEFVGSFHFPSGLHTLVVQCLATREDLYVLEHCRLRGDNVSTMLQAHTCCGSPAKLVV